jgi:hypothetical protein
LRFAGALLGLTLASFLLPAPDFVLGGLLTLAVAVAATFALVLKAAVMSPAE